MKNKLFALTAILATAALPALAEQNRHIDFAKVTQVTPIYKTIEHRVPHRECWTETVAYDNPRHSQRSQTGTLLGGLVGAAIGNGVGHHKRNKQVGAVAGAILGASIGRDISAKNSGYGSVTEYRDEQRCDVSHETEYEERLLGYDVTYKYHGMTYNTRMGHHPGKKIKVAVKVRPVH